MTSHQEAFSGETFTLREPPDQNRNIALEAAFDGKTGQYHVKLGTFSGSGFTLAFALHELATLCEDRELYGSENLTPAAIPDRKLRKCQYCGASIWFALTRNGKWMPLDAEPVRARHLKGTRRYAIVSEGRINRVKSIGTNTNQGTVWIAHPVVCGITPDKPEEAMLKERWVTNRKGAGIAEREVRLELYKDIDDLEE